MAKILIIANAANRARVFIPIADKLTAMGAKVTFVSLDSILYGGASDVLRKSYHPFVELPSETENPLFIMNHKERFRTLISIKPSIRELILSIKPDVILLGAAAYVEGVIIEEARLQGIKTVLMQDGVRIDQDKTILQKLTLWLIDLVSGLTNEWTLAFRGAHYFFTSFGTNRVDKILLFGNSVLDQLAKKGIRREKLIAVGNPMYDNAAPLPVDYKNRLQEFFNLPPKKPVILFGMQCFHKHNVLSIDDELQLFENLINTFIDLSDISLIIKLHPDNDYFTYQNKINELLPPENIYLVKDEFNPDELLGIATAFMTVYSTMALEALVYEVPVITLDYTKVPFHLNLEPAAFSAKSENDLKNFLENENWSEQLHAKMKEHRDHILDQELVNLGFAAEKAAETIMELIR